jgi:hypothetical protein
MYRERTASGKSRRRAAAVRAVSAAIVAMLALACRHHGPVVNVPAQATAAEQYAYAKQYQAGRKVELIGGRQDYMKAREVVKETYRKVGENFPDDRQFKPLAELDVIMMECGFDSPRVEMSERETRRAMTRGIDDLDELARAYPEHEYAQAMSLYLRGMCYMRMNESAEAQQCFKAVRDTYKNNGNELIKHLADNAAIYYNQVYVEP